LPLLKFQPSYILLVLGSEFYPLLRGHSCERSIPITIYTGLMYCTNGHDTMTVMLCILLRQSWKVGPFSIQHNTSRQHYKKYFYYCCEW